MSAYTSIHFTNGAGGELDALKVTARFIDGRVLLTAQTKGGEAHLTFSGEPAEVARLLERMQEAVASHLPAEVAA